MALRPGGLDTVRDGGRPSRLLDRPWPILAAGIVVVSAGLTLGVMAALPLLDPSPVAAPQVAPGSPDAVTTTSAAPAPSAGAIPGTIMPDDLARTEARRIPPPPSPPVPERSVPPVAHDPNPVAGPAAWTSAPAPGAMPAPGYVAPAEPAQAVPAPLREAKATVPPIPEPARDPGTWTSKPLPELTGRASDLLSRGDVASARLWLTEAADGGDADAVFRLAETYDPWMLREWGVVGLTSDAPRAKALYAKAWGGGVMEARARLERLGR